VAVDLADLVDSLKREVNPPGDNLFPNATENDWLGNLADAFWEARLHGMLAGFTVNPDTFELTPLDASAADMTRDLQQLIVLYAGFRITLNELKNAQSSFHAVAGPVEIEVQKASNVLKGVLDAIKGRIDIVLTRLSDAGSTSVAVFDAVIEHNYNIAARNEWWVR
jgi:hypothetical protein